MSVNRSALLILCTVMWGASFALTPIALNSFTPLDLMAARFGLAAALYASLSILRVIRLRPLPRSCWPRFVAMTAATVLIYNLALNYALLSLPAGLAAVAGQAAPIAVLGIERFRTGAFQIPRPVTGVLTWGIGTALVVLHFRHNTMLAGPWWAFVALSVTPLAIAAYSLISRPLLREHGAANVCAQMFIFGGLMLFATRGWRAEFWAQVGTASMLSRVSVGLLAAATTVLAYTLWFRQMEVLGASQVATYLTLVPLFGITFGAVVLHEPVSLWLVSGAAITIVGCQLTTFKSSPRARCDGRTPPQDRRDQH